MADEEEEVPTTEDAPAEEEAHDRLRDSGESYPVSRGTRGDPTARGGRGAAEQQAASGGACARVCVCAVVCCSTAFALCTWHAIGALVA